MNPITIIARQYLDAYQNKDLETIANLISPNVELTDWNKGGMGRDYFLAETKANFESQEAIEIDIIRVFELSRTVAFQLRIKVDHSEVLEVIDVLEFDSDNLITKLQAYKGL